jgi:hypothetical protein
MTIKAIARLHSTTAAGSLSMSKVKLKVTAGMTLHISGESKGHTWTFNFPPGSCSKEDAKIVAGILNGVQADAMYQE